jgi:FkbM family methyltransferase
MLRDQRGSGTAGLSATAVVVRFGGALLPLSCRVTWAMAGSASENVERLIVSPRASTPTAPPRLSPAATLRYALIMFVLAYAQRLAAWASVVRQIRGATVADRAVLGRAILRSPLTSLGNFSEWRNPTVDADCTVITQIGSFHIRGNSDDLFLALPAREKAIVDIMRRTLLPGDLFVDAGANIGVLTVLGSKLVGPAGRVIAVEMMPDTAAILRAHIADNQCENVSVVEAALSNLSGRTVRATVPPGKFGQASIVVDQPGTTIDVRTITLAEVIGDVSNVKLLKLDLEGAELDALKGLGDALEKIEAIIFEDRGLGAEASQWLEAHGFSVRHIDSVNALAMRPDSPSPSTSPDSRR